MHEFHQLSATSLQGQPINFNDFEGKVVLIVNTASKCGFTYQYESLQALHNKYASQGLVILGFPCNQFGQQEPGGATQIEQGCLINFGVSFLMAAKVDVNGEHAHPVFRYLKSALPGFLTRKIKWNFTKFLIAADGMPIKRYAPFTKPEKLELTIQKALAQAKSTL
ncbi:MULTISPECIES: glutathione peroxidase [Pseudoalteromonas]|uniref:Glutathione peroxidase n=1 Tax=Pseudoalteromonas fuliginea TaxID=1872678 RepID=A0A833AJR2_9GAMM|nr:MULTISPECIES: glutathione peroxidase [Pseudoalteromonas]KAA1162638.1 glutathione peroxidase [Pseudoalteromonas fuliginea]KAA1164245.1 glutathione peroxidase [Pseudoalteromonas fuliginea]KAA1168570.1 glutathione peroxidase [Pseudoalteromonas fuliginea]GAA79836.1 glutathione peroxidase [Pseudoalteromonas sp. BSi20495]